ncbi:bifunctional adenosylcobinamide kinase/adenosylcobinamide-phosphate guanylyltransferase [Neobacillus massiliamazoniensis]|uniref:Adenosylcobinamide kinase/adenosylcobinamide-phosphate guanylyltransferase n=1 Tax=Neobacillus massiliamazoniensis TaxID=1499688 RepID=A0A0U1NSN7_9BACI|nr:bifunctional adenosylcobinamide kinase/adenosylcobinamide-phosphate guanylyltransferase [Neobacillus massiliamazoniensis]CRK80975.1 adenosylcobinamide kinase/adenosylcobinamide-phosphate guanylyltransferase [Neobacillus massiliamazoniensis]
MHFITGGAFNGKRAWVKNKYKVTEDDCWLSAYENCSLPTEIKDINQNILILEGIEIWIKELTEKYDSNKCLQIWNECVGHWLKWETEQFNGCVVVIGTDITKGIVPVEKENRFWRDITGWAYQDLAKRSEKVDVIWYGINQTIK